MVNVSIIVTCEEQQPLLMELLPVLLSQHYNGEYEVIVVDKLHDKDMEEWLEEMEVRFPHLNHTFCPSSSRGIDIQKLALTLGAKSANYEWLVILPVGTHLPDDKWLAGLMARMDGQTGIVICPTKRKRRWSWFRSIFRPKFSIFRPTSSVIICRRRILLEGKNVKLSDCRIIK